MKALIKAIAGQLRRQWIPVTTFLGGLILTGVSYRQVVILDQDRIHQAFVSECIASREALQKRFDSYIRSLYDLRGLYNTNKTIRMAAFQRYMGSIEVAERSSGIHRIGYVNIERDVAGHVRLPLRYVYPGGPALPGFNVNMDQPRRQALEAARDMDVPVASSRTILASDLRDHHSTPAFVIYLPVFRAGQPHGTLAERRRAVKGYVFASFYPQQLVNGVFRKDFNDRIDLELFDSLTISRQALLYDSDGVFNSARRPDRSRHEYLTSLRVPGQVWTMRFVAKPALLRPLASNMPLFVLAGGILSTLLLAAIVWQLGERRRDMRVRLSQYQQFRSLLDHNPDPVFSCDLHGRFISVNQAGAELLGIHAQALVGMSCIDFTVPADRSRLAWYTRQCRKGIPQAFDMAVITRPRGRRELSITEVPIIVAGQCEGTFMIAKDITDARQKEKQLAWLAEFDTLTGLPNRALLQDRLGHALDQAKRHDRKLALMFLDLDKFKDINDSLGHAVGDVVLQTAATRLKSCLREEDTVARLGGDEFTVLLENIYDRQTVITAAENILRAFADPVSLNGRELFLTCSLGIAFYPEDAGAADDMMKAADMAMYAAKTGGRNTYRLYHARMMQEAADVLDLKNELKRALGRQQLTLYYQPQFDIQTQQITGVEALLRWRHPRLGNVSPGRFIPLAEELGIIDSIGEFVIETACRQSHEWRQAGLPAIHMAVNVSSRQFRDPGFGDFIQGVIGRTQMPPGLLALEITESALMDDLEVSERVLREIKGRGIKICVDDFGTGYSSLSYLVNFPLDVLKIDRSFVQNVPDSSTDATVAETIILMARNLNLEIVAEGIETDLQLEFLKKRHCHNGQGFLFSHPLAAAEMTGLLAAQQTANAA